MTCFYSWVSSAVHPHSNSFVLAVFLYHSTVCDALPKSVLLFIFASWHYFSTSIISRDWGQPYIMGFNFHSNATSRSNNKYLTTRTVLGFQTTLNQFVSCGPCHWTEGSNRPLSLPWQVKPCWHVKRALVYSSIDRYQRRVHQTRNDSCRRNVVHIAETLLYDGW